jgi:hypothetical protein
MERKEKFAKQEEDKTFVRFFCLESKLKIRSELSEKKRKN